MSDQPFRASRLKVERARRHISELDTEIGIFLARNPFGIQIEGDFHSHKWVLRVREDVPGHLAPIVGDVVHNLRAALDLLACELVRGNGGNDKNVYFPFAEDAAALETRIRECRMDRASVEAVEIVQTLKPYRGGNDELRAIHDLDIVDKHRALIPLADFAGIPDITMHSRSATLFVLRDCRIGPIRDGLVAMVLPAAENIAVGQEFKAAFHLTFGSDQPFSHEPLVPRLLQLTDLVNGVISTFESATTKSSTRHGE